VLLVLVLAICRAAGGADAHEDLVRTQVNTALGRDPADHAEVRASADRVSPPAAGAATSRVRRHRRPRLPTKVV
jgi:hypothetical protein